MQVSATSLQKHAGGPSGSGAPRGLQQPGHPPSQRCSKRPAGTMTRTALVPCVLGAQHRPGAVSKYCDRKGGEEPGRAGGLETGQQASRYANPRSGLQSEKHFLDPAKRQAGRGRGKGRGRQKKQLSVHPGNSGTQTKNRLRHQVWIPGAMTSRHRGPSPRQPVHQPLMKTHPLQVNPRPVWITRLLGPLITSVIPQHASGWDQPRRAALLGTFC